jgi:hypothetical protein
VVFVLQSVLGTGVEDGNMTKMASDMKESVDAGGQNQGGYNDPGSGGKGKRKKIFFFKGNFEDARNSVIKRHGLPKGVKTSLLGAIGLIAYIQSGQAEEDAQRFANNAKDWTIHMRNGDQAMADLDAAMLAVDALNLFGNNAVALDVWASIGD